MTDTTVAVLTGSTRNGRIGDRVAKWIADTMSERGHEVHLIDPNEYEELKVLNQPFHYSEEPSDEMTKIHGQLEESDGFIVVTPEYNHSYSGAIKNVLDNFMPEYEKKPFGIASYSASPFGGIRANEALRQVVSELKGVPTPRPFMLSHVHDVFGEDERPKDKEQDARLSRFLEDFEWYLRALKRAREES